MDKTPQLKDVINLCERALETDLPERSVFIDEACGTNEDLRRAVVSLLISIDESSDELELPELKIDSTLYVGKQIGKYEIVKEIGEGGMGKVFLAERQTDEFDHQVAIKIVHAHMLSKELVERFTNERQILASLTHPFIARLIDGGTTENGAPYLIMEYVEGERIDDYCNQHKLNIEL